MSPRIYILRAKAQRLRLPRLTQYRNHSSNYGSKRQAIETQKALCEDISTEFEQNKISEGSSFDEENKQKPESLAKGGMDRSVFTNNLKLKNDSDRFPSARSDTLSLFLVKFFRNESQILAETLDLDRSLDYTMKSPTTVDMSILNSNIREKIATIPDDYNRFVLLLSYHPLLVAPSVLMQLYRTLTSILPEDKMLLLRTLVFHNEWSEFWTVALSGNPTLSDIEDVIDLLHVELTRANNIPFGVWDSLRGALHLASTESMFQLIRESMEYKFNLAAEEVYNFCQFIGIITSASEESQLTQLEDSLSKLENITTLRVFILQKLVEINSVTSISKLKEAPTICTSSGFPSFLLLKSKNTHLASILASNTSALLNDLDAHILLSMADPSQHYQIFVSLCRSHRKGTIQSEYIYNKLVCEIHRTKSMNPLDVIHKFHKHLSSETWALLLPLLLSNSKDCELIKKLAKDSEKFLAASLSAIHGGSLGEDELLSLLGHCRNHKLIVRHVMKELPGKGSIVGELLKLDFTAYNLLELGRYLIKYQQSNAFALVADKVLLKTWPHKTFNRRIQAANRNHDDDFRNMYGVSTKEERHLLRIRIQALAQAISDSEVEQVANVLNDFYRFVFLSGDFKFVQSDIGKRYIFDRLLLSCMRFIYRKGSTDGSGVKRLRDVLGQLSFNSTAAQASLFGYIVMEKPLIAIEILKNYSKKKAFLSGPVMDSIESGLLKATCLEPELRLGVFQQFQRAKAELGYKSKLNPRTTGLFGSLIFSIADHRDLGDLKWVVQLALERGVPLRVVKNWSSRSRK